MHEKSVRFKDRHRKPTQNLPLEGRVGVMPYEKSYAAFR
jgi:hypothetical protein